MNRRHLLKLGAGSILAALISPFAFAQSKSSSAGAAIPVQLAAAKIDGVISYRAGRVIPLEEKAALLEVEAKKNKEKEDLDRQKSVNPTAKNGDQGDKSKSLSGKFNELLGKIKGYF